MTIIKLFAFALSLTQVRANYCDYQHIESCNTTDKIVGGLATEIEYFPYQVSITLDGHHHCGGSIISSKFVLTAAHCFTKDTSRYRVRVGSTYCDSGGTLYEPEEIYTHPKYKKATHDYDISIVQLEEDLEFGDAVAPVPLPEPDEVIPKGMDSVLTGWGRLTSSGESSEILQVVIVPTIDWDVCKELYVSKKLNITDRMFCAGFLEGGKDACQGDSGGPLTANSKQIGIVSTGFGCALENYPGVYASVPRLRRYIKKITGF